jgi:hypothetical protein
MMVVYLVLLACIGVDAAADGASSPRVGVGAYARGDDYRSQQFRSLQSEPTRHYTELVNQRITSPVIVRGEGRTTLVSGVVAINPSRIVRSGPNPTASLIEVQCPERGHRIVVRSSSFNNEGEIFSQGGGSAGIVVQKCYFGQPVDVEVTGDTFTNRGVIRAE